MWEGDYFEIRRTFLFRRSTVRMLNMIKAEHEDENLYLSCPVFSNLAMEQKNSNQLCYNIIKFYKNKRYHFEGEKQCNIN